MAEGVFHLPRNFSHYEPRQTTLPSTVDRKSVPSAAIMPSLDGRDVKFDFFLFGSVAGGDGPRYAAFFAREEPDLFGQTLLGG